MERTVTHAAIAVFSLRNNAIDAAAVAGGAAAETTAASAIDSEISPANTKQKIKIGLTTNTHSVAHTKSLIRNKDVVILTVGVHNNEIVRGKNNVRIR